MKGQGKGKTGEYLLCRLINFTKGSYRREFHKRGSDRTSFQDYRLLRESKGPPEKGTTDFVGNYERSTTDRCLLTVRERFGRMKSEVDRKLNGPLSFFFFFLVLFLVRLFFPNLTRSNLPLSLIDQCRTLLVFSSYTIFLVRLFSVF